MKNKGEAIATIQIKNASKMSPALRHELAKWMRNQGIALENHAREFSDKFVSRYYLS